ncbi:putative gag-polypeptide of LTR copia-type [Rosa chinensis]|uniref:Putative gag-polypeptide of LTR copia-type n=1 Tax=Rosa chinensis TaxID=74649 RepID=A0A2P6SFD4_ROSCH|nr:putative gag-polypeptide of LTR copia-type [Rosa chinensis]
MAVVQSPIHSLLSMITVRLEDGNYITWSFQLQSLLEGNDLFGFLDGTNVCPPQFVFTEKDGVTTTLTPAFRDWKKTDRALISLIIATLSPEAMEYVVGL